VFVLRIQSLLRNSRIWFKVARAERMYIHSPLRLRYDPHYLRSSERWKRRLNVARTYARRYICASAKIHIIVRPLMCVDITALQSANRVARVARILSGRIFFTKQRQAYICKWNAFLCTFFRSFTFTSMHSHRFAFQREIVRNPESNVSIRLSPQSWVLRCAKKRKEASKGKTNRNE